MSISPDSTPDLVTAAFRELNKLSSTLKAAGVGSDDVWDPWLFAWRPQVTVNGSGLCSIVIVEQGGWSSPNRHNTLEFPRLLVEIYADIDRDSALGPYVRSAQRKAKDVWRIVDDVMHRPDAGGFMWGDANGSVRVVSSYRNAEPRIDTVPDTDGAVFLTVTYEVQLG